MIKHYRILLWVSSLEALAAAIYLFLIPGDPKNSLLIGFSLVRLVNLAGFLILAFCLSIAGFWLHRFSWLSNWLSRRADNLARWQRSVWVLCLIMFVLWLVPIYRFKDFDLIWDRLLPSVLLAVGLILTFLGYLMVEGSRKGYLHIPEDLKERRFFRTWILVTAGALLAVIIAQLTGFGIIPPLNRFWNTAGVPILFEQVLYLVFGLVFISGLKTLYFPNHQWRMRTWIIFILVWAGAFLVWNAQPIAKSYFVYQPEAPNYEYYPLSDAQRFDLGGRFLLNGQSIFKGITEEKPFLMAYMALLAVVSKPEYSAMVRTQLLVLSLVAPLLYLIGKRLHSDLFGLGLAITEIFYEVNTFNASVEINSAHIKLLLSEPLTYLGVVLIVYLMIRWMDNPLQTGWGVLTTGLIAFFAYIRANVLMLLPTAFILFIWIIKNKFKEGGWQFTKASTGFGAVLLPWMVYAKITFGYIPIFNKLKFILNTRILEVWRFSNPVVTKLSLFIGGGILLNRPTFWDTLHLQAAHFANNLIKSILIFPTTLRLTSIEEVLRQPYWDESILWDGAVEPLFYLNLAILLLGMAALVRARGKITLVPLVISLAYNLSTALATTSGGRYLKPAIWVFILYYLAGLYYLLDLLLSAAQFTPSTESLSTPAPEQQKRSSNPGRWFWAASAAMLFIGLLVPTVDAAIPQKYDQLSKQETVGLIPGDALASLGADQEAINRLITDKDLRVYYGDGLYPRRVIDDKYFDYFAFSIVGPYHAMEARYYGSWDGIQDFANNSPVIALGCNAQIEDDEFANIILIYLPDQQAVYSVGIDWQTFCPVSP